MNDWVTIGGDDKTLTVRCRRCGTSVTVKLPVSVTTLAALGDGFAREHRKCRERAK